MKNAKHFGEVTVFIYPSKDRYIGVCLELDLIDDDRDKEVLTERMKQRLQSYVTYIQKKNLDDSFLNRPAPKKYWNKFYQFLDIMREEEKKRMHSPLARDFIVSRQSLVPEPV